MKKFLSVLCLAIAVSLCGAPTTSARADVAEMLYKKEYQVKNRFRVTRYVRPNIRQSKFTYMFRTRISNAGKLGYPNFANHYIVETWGCGTSCQLGAIINALTGQVMDLPLAAFGYRHTLDSRVLVVNPVDPFDKEECNMVKQMGEKTYYFLVQSDRLIRLKSESPKCDN